MDKIKRIMSTLEHILNTKRKRHIVGGILLSASIFLGAMAVTVMSMIEENDYEQQII